MKADQQRPFAPAHHQHHTGDGQDGTDQLLTGHRRTEEKTPDEQHPHGCAGPHQRHVHGGGGRQRQIEHGVVAGNAQRAEQGKAPPLPP